MVLTEDDYLDFLVAMTDRSLTKVNRNALLPAVEGALMGTSLVFIGYRLSDWNFRVLFRGLPGSLEKSLEQLHVAVQLPPDDEKERDYLDAYYGRMEIKVYWDWAGDFVAHLYARYRTVTGMADQSVWSEPYLGPQPFDRADADRFYARTVEARELFAMTVAHQVVVLYAESGAGKTSLLRAGLQTVAATPLRVAFPRLRANYPLADLDGLSVYAEGTLLGEGIEDMSNLVTCNLVDVLLHTRLPVARLVDWVDQASLYLHLPPPGRDEGWPSRRALRRIGIRTATELERILATGELADDQVRPLRPLMRSLAQEANFPHVRAWRSDALDGQTRLQQPLSTSPESTARGAQQQ